MPTRRRAFASRPIIRDRAAVAQAGDSSQTACQCSVSIVLNEVKLQAAINIQLSAEFENIGEQTLTLRLPVDSFSQLRLRFTADQVPGPIKDQLLRSQLSGPNDQLLTLTIEMTDFARLLMPSNVTILVPTCDFRAQVRNFQSLCQAKQLILYIPAYDLSNTQRGALQAFSHGIASGTLMPLPVDSRHDVRETSWEALDVPESPPPYTRPPESQTLGKRIREASPTTAGPAAKRSAATSSVIADPTISIKDSILVDALRRIVQDVLVETLPGMLRRELETALAPIVREALPATLEEVLPDVLTPTAETAGPFQALLGPIVRKSLPQVLEDYIDENDFCEAAELHVEEWKEDAVMDMRATKEEYVEELTEVEQRFMDELLGLESEVMQRLSRTIRSLEDRAEELAEQWATTQQAVQAARDWSSIPDAQVISHPPSLSSTTASSFGTEEGKATANVEHLTSTPPKMETSSPAGRTRAADPALREQGGMLFTRGSTTEPDTESEPETEPNTRILQSPTPPSCPSAFSHPTHFRRISPTSSTAVPRSFRTVSTGRYHQQATPPEPNKTGGSQHSDTTPQPIRKAV